MKKIFWILLFPVLILSCQQDEIPPIGDRTDYISMLTGTWQMTKFVQIDADAESKGFPRFATEKDLTNVFPGHSYTTFSITFKADGTFTTNKGTSYMQILESGTWKVDNNDYPSALVLTSGNTIQNVSLGSLADVIVGKVQFREERKQIDTGKVKIKYIYSLTKN